MILSALWTGGDLSGSILAGRGLVCVKMRAIIAHPLLVLMICIGSCRSFLPRWSPKSLHHHARQKQSLARFIARTDTVNQILEKEFQGSLRNTFGQEYGTINPLIGASKVYDGEYQSTVALQLSKSLKQPPKEIAQKIVSSLPYGKVIERAEVSGPGFINIFLAADYVSSRLLTKLHNHGQRVGIDIVGQPQRIVVDFSSPNIAKEMHVGHLRSTIIGDSISRVLEFLGNDVVRLNHVGDWGTQFGMLIHYLKTQRGSESDDLTAVSIGNLLEFYQKAKKIFDADVAFQASARQEVVRLQAGDVDSVRAWQLICQKSREEFQQIYDLLGVSLSERGESYYNAMLQPLVTSLLEAGVAEKSEDAVVIFLDKYKTSDGKLLPLIVRKSDGGFLYATTDMAALKHRVEVEKARRIIYVTDAGQAQHFEMVFDAARKAGILDDMTTTVTHVPFGLVLGEDGKKIKTRAGESVKLRELLLEAVDRARREFLSRSLAGNEEDEEVRRKAVVMGMGAVKYADLSMNRESNYRFSFDKMLSLQGNTAPYMLYAYVRIRGIQRKMLPLLSPTTSSVETVNLLDAETLDALTSDLFLSFQSSDFLFSDTAELSLARHLLRSDDVLLDVANSLYPNKMCEYLFELSQRFNQFYENCPVVKAPDAATMRSRLALCTVTAHTIRLYLHLLGIQTLEEI